MPLVCSDDYGRDFNASESLFLRHVRLEEEIQAYRADILRLDDLAALLAKTQFNFDKSQLFSNEEENSSELCNQFEEVIVPKVSVLYPYDGKGIHVGKDEVLALLDKSNADWWRILKHDGVEGYVPANYCKMVPGETVALYLQKIFYIIKNLLLILFIKVTVSQQIPVTKKPVSQSEKSKNAILDRQETISSNYRKLCNLAQNRHRLLGDAIKLFKFFNYCNDFESWAKEMNNLIQENVPMDHIQAFQKKFKVKINEEIL